MENIETVIFRGGADSDTGWQDIAKGDYIELQYCRLGQATGHGFSVTTSKGTRAVANGALTANDTVFGKPCKWIEGNSIIYFVHSSIGNHSIWAFNVSTEVHTLKQTSSAFNFNLSFPITHSNVVGGTLDWVDARWNAQLYDANGLELFNEPKQIMLNNTYSAIDKQVCSAIKWPPPEPTAVYVNDLDVHDNKMRNKLFKFRLQGIYENNKKSAWSHYSNLALPTRSELVSGIDYINDQTDNAIDITFWSGPNCVKILNIGVQRMSQDTNGVETPFGIFRQYKKAVNGSEDNQFITIRYYGTAAESVAFDADKPYDRVPRWAACQELLPTNELAYTNFREGFDKPTLDVGVTIRQKEIFWRPQGVYLNLTTTKPSYITTLGSLIGAISDNIIEGPFNFQEGDTFSITVSGTVYTYTITVEDMMYAMSNYIGNDQNAYMFTLIYDNIFSFLGLPTMLPTLVFDIGSLYRYQVFGTPSEQIGGRITFTRSTNSRPTLKTGAEHAFGIEYYNESEQGSTVCTNEDFNLVVPFPPKDPQRYLLDDSDNPYTSNPIFSLNHIPPIDCTHYRMFTRDTTSIIDFQQNAIIDMVADGEMFKISIDNFYPQTFEGATINHQIQKGDIVRFLRYRVDGVVNPPKPAYLGDYFETQVLKYSDNQGTNGYYGTMPQAIWVDKFDVGLIEMDATLICGQVIEIYTPRPTMDEGGLFLSKWRSISEKIPIGDAHLPTRYHTSPDNITGTCIQANISDTFVIVEGSISFPSAIVGKDILLDSGTFGTYTIVSSTYDSITNQTTINLTGSIVGGVPTPLPFSISFNQIVSGGISTTAATIFSDWGNVYLRQRLLGSSFSDAGLNAFYQYIEDPHYSDYWLSKYVGNGIFSFESIEAKLTHRKATSIHSDPFVDNSQLDGTASFGFELYRIQDMNDDFGAVSSTILDGKTLKCLQTSKENSIYIKSIPQYVDNVGQAPILSGKTFAQWNPYEMSTYGCEEFGAAILVPEIGICYWDKGSRAFIMSATNSQVNLSEKCLYQVKSNEIAALYENYTVKVRSFINEQMSEVCWAFGYGSSYLIIAFDYKALRFRSVYDYNFTEFQNLKGALVGFGTDDVLYVHNQNSFTFHGESVTEKIIFAANDGKGITKRYMDIKQIGNKTFAVKATTDENQSYGIMETEMTIPMFKIFVGNSHAEYRNNKFSPNFASEALAMVNGEQIRGIAVKHELSRPVDSTSVTNMIKIRTV